MAEVEAPVVAVAAVVAAVIDCPIVVAVEDLVGTVDIAVGGVAVGKRLGRHTCLAACIALVEGVGGIADTTVGMIVRRAENCRRLVGT